LDAGGDAVAVWQRSNGSNTIIESASRPVGSSWGAATDLSAPGQNAKDPQLRVGAGGQAIAVWRRYDGSDYRIQAAERAPSGSWSPPVDLSAPGESAEEPEIAVGPQGTAVAVWQRSNGTNTIVQAAVRPPGGPWGAAADLSSSGDDASEPTVAVLANGEAIALWRRFDGSENLIEGSACQVGGTWSTTPVALSAPGQNAADPQVASGGGATAVAVWQRFNGANEVIQSTARGEEGAWTTPIDLSSPGQNAAEPDLAARSDGTAVAAWQRSNGADTVVESTSRSPGGAWDAPGALSAVGQNAQEPAVALSSNGSAFAVWRRSNGVNTIVQGSVRASGGAWSLAASLSVIGFNASEPQVAADSEGNGVAVWQRFDGANTIVQSSGFDGAGPRLLGLSITAAGTIQQPLSFAVSPFDVWSPVTAVQWSFGDGEGALGTTVSHAYLQPGSYQVAVTATDGVGNASTASAVVTIFPNAWASRYARLRHRRALLRVHCPSTADCQGEAELIAGIKIRHGHRHARRPIGRSRFDVPPQRTTTVPILISRPGRAAVQAAGSKGIKAQLTGAGIRHRSVVVLLPQPHRE
jgi:hypothetical protein